MRCSDRRDSVRLEGCAFFSISSGPLITAIGSHLRWSIASEAHSLPVDPIDSNKGHEVAPRTAMDAQATVVRYIAGALRTSTQSRCGPHRRALLETQSGFEPETE